MKKVMLLVVALLAVTGCTTLQNNESALKNACKAGIEKYDDGSTSFSCYSKEVKNDKNNVSKDK